MSDIFKIQDYSNRMNRTQGQINQLKNMTQGVEKNSGTDDKNKTKAKTFQEILEEDISPEIMGKVSSNEVHLSRNIQDEIKDDPYRKKLYDASVEFESMFVKLMLKEMKSSVSKNKMIHGGYAEEIFEDMLTDEQAKEISKYDSIGIAEQIYSSLSQSLPPLKA